MARATLMVFRGGDPAAVIEVIERHRRAGHGWVNLRPDFGDDAYPAPARSWFSGRGPAIPVASLVAAKANRDGSPRPLMVGLEHGVGPRAVARLRESGVAPDPQWRVRQDHPRRGIVLEVGHDQPTDPVVRWVLAAAAELCRFVLPDDWTAEVWE